MILFYSNPVDKDLLQSRKINNDLNEYIRLLGINIDRPEYIFNKEWLNYFLFKDIFYQSDSSDNSDESSESPSLSSDSLVSVSSDSLE